MGAEYHVSSGYLRLKEAAVEYRVSLSTMSRLVRRLRVELRRDPRDGRSKLVRREDLERALGRRPRWMDDSEERRRLMLEGLEKARLWRERDRRLGRTFLPVTEALAIVRGEAEDDSLR